MDTALTTPVPDLTSVEAFQLPHDLDSIADPREACAYRGEHVVTEAALVMLEGGHGEMSRWTKMVYIERVRLCFSIVAINSAQNKSCSRSLTNLSAGFTDSVPNHLRVFT